MVLGSSESLKYLFAGDTDQTVGSVLYFISMIREGTGTNNTLKVLDVSRIIPDTERYQYSPEALASSMGLMLEVKLKHIIKLINVHQDIFRFSTIMFNASHI